MSVLRAVLATLTLFALALPMATAATLTLDKKPDVIPYDAPTTLQATYTDSCTNMVQDTNGNPTTIDLIPDGEIPPWLKITGEKMPWGDVQKNCALPGSQDATTHGKVTITPTVDAPALQAIAIKVNAKMASAVKASAELTPKIAYHGSLNATSDKDLVKAGLADRKQFNLTLDFFTNAKGTVTVTRTENLKSGTLEGLGETIDINPPVQYIMTHPGMGPMWMEGGPGAGQPQSMFVPLFYRSSATPWAGDNLTLELVLKAVDDPSLATSPVTVHWSFQPDATVNAGGKSPGPEPLVLLAAIALLVIARRRHA